jgi:hypothetical protein
MHPKEINFRKGGKTASFQHDMHFYLVAIKRKKK